jgi:hypothetical protein
MDWKRPGAKFYLDWMDHETDKLIQEIAERWAREANEAWIRNGFFSCSFSFGSRTGRS